MSPNCHTERSLVLIFSRDLGGTNMMIAAYERLFARSSASARAGPLLDFLESHVGDPGTTDVHVTAKHFAVSAWRRAGVEPTDIDELAGDVSPAQCVQKILEFLKPSVVLTATTDVDDRTDVEFWRACRKHDIPTAALVDHRVNLHMRFFDSGACVVYPNQIFVIDEFARRQLVDEGVSPHMITVVGDLHLERLTARASDRALQGRARKQRENWGIGPDDVGLLFVSECLREMRAGRSSRVLYDEVESLEHLLRVLRSETRLGDHTIDPSRTTLVIRPHPKDVPGKYEQYETSSNAGTDDLRVLVDATGASETAICASDIVVGMDSTMLGEARALGRSVVSNCWRNSDGHVRPGDWHNI